METDVRRRDGSPQRQVLLVLMAVGLIGTVASASRRVDVVVIVNQENPVSELSLSELRHIFRGERKYWRSGDTIRILLPRPGTPAMEALVENVFQMGSVAELGQYYMAAIFQQKLAESPPTASPNEAARVVSKSKNALAIISRTGAIGKSGIKIITVDGL